ncbi:MAG: type II secretion system protein [Deltaproteobacteria bacterium]|nr:type II secretion system protein [Deltaproteobacteria bacterium]
MTPFRRRQGAFTLIELMVVVAIIGVLAAVAVPAFMRYIRKAKTTEAVENIQKMYGASRSYLLEETQARGQIFPLPPQFPETEPLTPTGTCCGNAGDKCVPGLGVWDTPTWHALQFAMTMPHYYRYEYESTGSAGAGAGSRFTVRAFGDLDCDGVFSTFEMVGVWSNVDHDVHGSGGIFVDLVLE